MEKHHPSSTGHETADTNIRGVVYSGIGLAVGLLLFGLTAYGVFDYMVHQPVAGATESMMRGDGPHFPLEPRIEDRPTIELKELHRQEELLLSSYGWTDKKAGIVRIPIERALELQSERGLPTRKGPGK